jgi:putative lipase involved disintegration of autophagic bodies
LQVWITGHSLGGGYANAVMLHMLANRTCAELFGAGAALMDP